MSVFKDYSKYYNLLYKDKDYTGEADYIISLIKANSKGSKSILNLGCGTGNHDFIFSEKGFDMTGVDLSKDMVEIANAKKKALGNDQIHFLQGDIRSLELNKTFDVVISLFHVMSYQVTNDDLEKTFQVVYKHLKKDGVFIFDFWHGPGVLTDMPVVRNKTFENETFQVKRLSTPVMHFNDNMVDVNFDVTIHEKETGANYKLSETHHMRYFFIPELKYMIEKNGFKFKIAEEWLTGKELTNLSWNATVICSK